MTKSVHDLTMEDMKGITFQVVPSLYWKYEWSFNNYMIHEVGKLNPPSDNMPMYDMLGNVWEWVRDDWSEKVSNLNGKVNPIVGTRSSGGNSDKKVIRGGAFDQLIRKVTSASREGLERNKSKSFMSTQSNVGFRPAMVFTSEADGVTTF